VRGSQQAVQLRQSEHALELSPNVEIHRIPLGTHLAVWTDPTSDAVQARIVDHQQR